ncbi:hypothetical protein AMELA_G00225080 [Ameiurus melas]|uniref:Uncharacterized protein n=1 Tax=Ameiurus melas TaxID=219545 RepID=A0A7J6A245_AMEME|nr:hypothetical protein AMELA_G00225080 [Ameiurus melas]
MRAMSLTEMPGFSLPSAMQLALPARSTDNLDSSGEHATRSVGTSANLKGKMSKRLSVVKGHFPKLTDCAHFHYDNVNFGSIEVGDILSVIDMPPKEETTWWRGKHGFQVGFFPSECVELINEKMPQSVSTPAAKTECDAGSSRPGVTNAPGPPSPTSVSKKHGKLMGFLRAFMKSRPSKQKLKQRGILKERVFGCDLGEHLLNSGLDVPEVLKSCSEFIEKHGIVDGIYRHSGISSNIQKLRHEFDSENVPDLTKDVYMQDIHCVGSLCKLYFRELPNPLLTYQLYDKFADCMGEMTEDERMVKVHDVIQQLPPPHYRTLEYLIKHLARLATFSEETNMHIKNLAIVWAPNLLRSKEIEAAGLNGADPFKEVRIQSVVVEFLLTNVEVLFSDSFTSVGRFAAAGGTERKIPRRPPRTRLVSLQEARGEAPEPGPIFPDLDADQRRFSVI